MVDFKYHLITLTAVFLALALGIFIGTALPGAELVWGEQQDVIAELQSTFAELKNESNAVKAQLATLKQQNTAAEEFGSLGLAVLTRRRLEGLTVGLVTPSDAAAGKLREVLRNAGAKVVWEVVSVPGTSLRPDPPAPADAAVLVGPWPKDTLAEVGAFCQALKGQRVRVIAAVPAREQNKSALPFQEWRVSSVDNIDSSAGLATLVALLAGAEGHFGCGATASDGFLPALVHEWERGA